MEFDSIIKEHKFKFSEFMDELSKTQNEMNLLIEKLKTKEKQLDSKINENEVLKKTLLNDRERIKKNEQKADSSRSTADSILNEAKIRLEKVIKRENSLANDHKLLESQREEVRKDRADISRKSAILETEKEKLMLLRKQVDNLIEVKNLRNQING